MLTTPPKGTDAEYVAEYKACLTEVKEVPSAL